MHTILAEQGHRPWPSPAGPWTWRQRWESLLFLHWPVPAERLRPLVPAPLRIQEFQGRAWVGVVPFAMRGVAPRWLPAVPWLSNFPELNVRLYVEFDGKPGVWFLSLHATQPVAIWAARTFFYLPYLFAHITANTKGGQHSFSMHRSGPQPLTFNTSYKIQPNGYHAEPGSLEEFLVERYCLYTFDRNGRLYRGHVHHVPWTLHSAYEVEVSADELLGSHGICVSDAQPLAHYSPGVRVALWPYEQLDIAAEVNAMKTIG